MPVSASNPEELAKWQSAYMDVLKKATLLNEGKQLVLKTPAHTGRVGLLTTMFPGAKYVFIVRNPYQVYQSMRNMYRMILPGQNFQDFEWNMIDNWILHAYDKLLNKYLEQRSLIPPEDLVEIRFEELDREPMLVMRRIYSQLQLGDFEKVAPQLQSYLDSLGSYRKNAFEFPDELINTVNKHWGFAFEAFGYEKMTTFTPDTEHPRSPPVAQEEIAN